MNLLDHVSISVKSIEKARPFYDAIMTALGAAKIFDVADRLGYGERGSAERVDDSYISIAEDGTATHCEKRHWCFKAVSRAAVDEFYRSGLAAGGKSNGEPGIRAHYHLNYYAAFLIDPDGNQVEAVCHQRQ